MAKRVGPKAPEGYVFCKGTKWRHIAVCEQCRYRKRCVNYIKKTDE